MIVDASDPQPKKSISGLLDRNGSQLRLEERMRKHPIHSGSSINRCRCRISARVTALAVTAALLVGPTVASARPIDDPNLPESPASNPAPATTLVEVSEPDGFDWGDAAIGAGGLTGAIALGFGCALGVRRLKADPTVRRMPAASSS
jgi:hypothetical protein